MRAPYNRYLRLLGFSTPPNGFDGLRALVSAHLCRVPFENISKLLLYAREGRGRVNTLDEFLDGIEFHDLGGTCYTINPFLAELLRALGYDADLLGAGMSNPNVHTCLRVRLDGRAYHVDAGYGAPYYNPIPLDELPHEILWGPERHIFESHDGGFRMLELSTENDRPHSYTPNELARSFEFFQPIIEASYAPGAGFLNRLRICRFFGDRSVDLHNTRCRWNAGSESRQREIASLEELRHVLDNDFRMPRAPIEAAVAALERNTGRPLVRYTIKSPCGIVPVRALERNTMVYTRRDVAKVALAAWPVAKAFGAAPNSRIDGVQIGAISYSFRQVTADVDEIIKLMLQIGLSEIELMSNSVELAVGAPQMPRMAPPQRPAGAPNTPPAPPTAEQMAAMRARQNSPEMLEAREKLAKWRTSVSPDTFKPVRKKFDSAGIDLHLLTYNFPRKCSDEEIEYAFQMAKALGVKGITTSTQVSIAKRVAPFADKHKMMVGYHGHDNTADPEEFATLETYATAMALSKYSGVNLDVGHFTASNYDAVAFIKEHHKQITNLHIKDRKKNHGPNVVFGQGDTPIKDVLQLLKKEKYPIPANIEYEYRGESDPATEVAKCFEYCKQALA